MSSPSSSTRPVIQPFSESSCIRFRVRRKVDLPHPDGPIRACTWCGAKPSETPFTAVNLPYMTVSLSVAIFGAAAVAGATGFAVTRVSSFKVLTAGSAIQCKPPADGQSCAKTQQENQHNEHERRRPRVLVPFLVWPGGIGEHGQRQCGHRLIDIEAQVLTA